MKKVIITGSTGMVGKGVLLECLEDSRIKEVTIINRSTLHIKNKKLKEVILKDFKDLPDLAPDFSSYDACFYCMGISSAGMSEEKFSAITYDITKIFVDYCHSQNPDMVFNYVSGEGTDSSEKGKLMWARVKGKTENMMLSKGFKDAYAFRPMIILPEKGVKSGTKLYQFFYVIARPFFPLLRKMKNVTTSSKLGQAMINTLFFPQEQKHLENLGINDLSSKH